MGKEHDQILLQTDILRTLTDNLPDMLWIKDLQGRYLFANKAICENLLMATDTEEPIGKTDLFFALRERAKHPDNPEWHTFGELCQNSDEIVAKAGKPMRFKEWGNVRGKLLYLEVHKAPFYDQQGKMLGVLGSGRDITDQVLMKEQLEKQKSAFEYQSLHDPLTGLPNRQFFMEHLGKALQRRRHGEQGLAVCFIDLDHFKDINDVFGHDRGDQLLRLMANRLKACIRESDILARLGGDEFTLMVEGVEHPRDLEQMANKLLNCIRKPVELHGITHHVTASIGISLTATDGEQAEDLLKFADTAMYRAKEKGKNRFEFYTVELTERARLRLKLENDLRLAMQEQQFVVHYQPLIDLCSGKISGVEALVRWQHPEAGLLGPGAFIDAAERTDLIVGLDCWVYQEAVRQLQQWKARGLVEAGFTQALNVSPVHLEQDGFVDFFSTLLAEHEIEPREIELEITETQLLRNIENTREKLTRLKAMGIRLAIDDFGTGYSSFTYLKKLSFDTLKIDRSFIQDIPDATDDASIVQGMLAMARALGMRVVAEGVETPAQLEFLKGAECLNAQGYLFARPMAAPEMAARLQQQREQASAQVEA